MLELADEGEAIRVAQKLAEVTGRRVTVSDATFTVLETIPAASIQ